MRLKMRHFVRANGQQAGIIENHQAVETLTTKKNALLVLLLDSPGTLDDKKIRIVGHDSKKVELVAQLTQGRVRLAQTNGPMHVVCIGRAINGEWVRWRRT